MTRVSLPHACNPFANLISMQNPAPEALFASSSSSSSVFLQVCWRLTTVFVHTYIGSRKHQKFASWQREHIQRISLLCSFARSRLLTYAAQRRLSVCLSVLTWRRRYLDFGKSTSKGKLWNGAGRKERRLTLQILQFNSFGRVFVNSFSSRCLHSWEALPLLTVRNCM